MKELRLELKVGEVFTKEKSDKLMEYIRILIDGERNLWKPISKKKSLLFKDRLLNFMLNNDTNEMSLREISRAVGAKYPQKTKHHLNRLHKAGLIK